MKKYRDDICRIGKCVNVGVCLGLCPLVKHTDGKSKSKEVLLSSLTESDNLEYRDYKADIAERAEDIEERELRQKEKLQLISDEPNSPKKFYELALLAGFTVDDIAAYTHRHRSVIYRSIKKAP